MLSVEKLALTKL